ncbi:hypothetical protein BDM02DRAFT_1380719 [Thelephora ganbajun]|uniref:Uncharacterized protein n=1 Tax=Thelephora ganbajun TaxID=370292 RepID=A0ACB6ZLL0_THEGA|nr:hypothetical protein BDM02DRAFT_1380719 [Thelephora ganbajun]
MTLENRPPRFLCLRALSAPVKGRHITPLSLRPFAAFTGGDLAILRSLSFPFSIPIQRMSFVDDDSLSLAGLDTPDLLQLDDSFSSASSSSLTTHCHSSCTSSTCMRDSGRRNPKGPRSSSVTTTEEVRTDVDVRPPISTSTPLRRIIHPIMTATFSNLSHPSHKHLLSTCQSFGTYMQIRPPPLTYRLPSPLENPPSTIPRSAPPMVTTEARAPGLRRSPDPQRSSTSAMTRILPGQVQSDDISCHARMVLSRVLVGILDRNQGVALELPILQAAAQVLEASGAISLAFAGSVGSRGTFAFLRRGCTPSRLFYEKHTVGNP